jgi:RNA polymerase sigma-70 factor, ECF subfamily
MVASRICLDLLSSARARRETYVGAWLPRAATRTHRMDHRAARHHRRRPGRPGNSRRLDQHGVPGRARSDDPAERVAFILHNVFGYPFTDIADIVGPHPAGLPPTGLSARRRIRAGLSQSPGSQAPATATAQQASPTNSGQWTTG